MPTPDPEAVVATLQRAKDLLLAQGWRQYWTLAHGIQGPVCLGIALRTADDPTWLRHGRGVDGHWQVRSLETSPVGNSAWTAVQQACHAAMISNWNDAPERTVTDVLDVLDAAIRFAKEAPHE